MVSGVGANHLDTELLQNTVLFQVQCAVQRSLAAHGWQQASGRSFSMILATVDHLIGSM